ncbi:MAG: exosortase-associated EpsI family protein [Armatimonadetes bacterium]|nr:exosortase-associated EpsI family protein [Armatimonadota bacterium]
MSSTYAAMLGGLLGLPIQREGIQLAIVTHPGASPVYSVLVAQGCSGLISMMVLLSLGYLVAYHTLLGRGGKALLVASMIPLALLTNTLRLTFILLAGAHHSRALAQWVHDNEAPFLIFLSSFAILGLRKALLSWEESRRKATLAAGPPWNPSNPGMPEEFPAREQAVMVNPSRQHLLVNYFFTDGNFSTDSIVRYQMHHLLKRLKREPSMGALVRVIVPIRADVGEAEAVSQEFSRLAYPRVLESLQKMDRQP